MSKKADKECAKAELNEMLGSPLRRKFAIAFAENGGNGTKAAEIAGYACPAVEAVRLLKDEKVLAAIERHIVIMLTNASESRETILARDVNWTKGDLADYFMRVPILKDDGTVATDDAGNELFTDEMRPITSLSKPVSQRLKKIIPTRYGFSLEIHDPGRANRHLAEYAGMLKQKVSDMTPVEAASAIHNALKEMDKVDGTSSPGQS